MMGDASHGSRIPRLDAVIAALSGVIDPEIGRDVVSLGMVYAIELGPGSVAVRFTLTTPGCPLAGVMLATVEAALDALPGVEEARVHLVWDPPWHPTMIAD